MERRGGLFVVALLCAWGLIGVDSQANIDTVQPIHRAFPEMDPTNDEYFGYSAVLHRVSVPAERSQSLQSTRIIVSAPNASVPGSPIDFTGALYICQLTQDTCDPFDAFDRFYDTEGNVRTNPLENKVGQFLGVAMDSRDGNFVACAHRYIDRSNNGNEASAWGRCFLTEQRDLSGGFVTVEPCAGRGRQTGSFGYCVAGTSAVWARNNDGSLSLGMGAPGSYRYSGVLFRRTPSGTLQLNGEDEGTNEQLWMGYATTTGRMVPTTNREDFIVSVTRGNTYTGYVNIIRNNNNQNVLAQVVVGRQTGEYFGFSLLTADLNGDSVDELLVGAPMYTLGGQPEIGRVFVYNNVDGTLVEARTLVGNVSYARFGYAMANLGDINGDSLHDVAISAPFGEGLSGTVFIYRGSVLGTLGANPVQVIVGSMVTTPLGLPLPSSFGASLASGVDVDMNGYNDLVVGAFESQQVFLLRTRSVAVTTVTFTSDPTTVNLESRTCARGSEMLTCFDVQVCVTYTGTELESSNIDYTVTLSAESQSVQDGLLSRLFFEGNCPVPMDTETCSNTIELLIENVPYNTMRCVDQTVYVKPNINDIFSAFQLDMSVAGPEFTTSVAGSGPTPTNLDSFPVIQVSGPSSLQVAIQNACAGTICYPDLSIEITSVTLGTTTQQATTSFIGGLVRSVDMDLRVVNNGDDAFTVRLVIDLPSPDLSYSRVTSMRGILCSGEASGMMGDIRTCSLANRLPPGETINMTLILAANRFITENTEDIVITFEVSSVNAENNTDLADNSVQQTFSFEGLADVFLEQAIAIPESLTYMNTTPTNVMNVTDLGPPVSVTFAVRNAGPTVANIDLMIYWPLMAAGQEDIAAADRTFYFYPFEFTREADVSVTCTPDLGFNPSGFLMPAGLGDGSTDEGIVSGKKKRRRRYLAHVESRNKRRKRQENEGMSSDRDPDAPVEDLTIDCTTSNECYEIPCQITSLPANQTASVTINGYLDERFFASRADRFTFIIASNITTNRVQPENDRTDMQQVQVRVLPIEPQVAAGDPIPIWVIIVPIVLGVLAIVTLGVILYLVGFFKRKHKQKKEEIAAQYLGDPADAAPATT